MPAVLLVRRRADDLDAAPAQGGLEDVCSVDGALGPARAHHGVQLVDEQDHVACLGRLLEQIPDPLLKLSAVLGPRDQGRHVQTVEPLAPQADRHPAPEQPLRQRLRDRRFSHARRPDQSRAVFLPAAEDENQLLQLRVPAEHRVPRPAHRDRKLFQDSHEDPLPSDSEKPEKFCPRRRRGKPLAQANFQKVHDSPIAIF